MNNKQPRELYIYEPKEIGSGKFIIAKYAKSKSLDFNHLRQKPYLVREVIAVDQKQDLLENVSDLMVLADQLLLMEGYQDRLNGSNMKESLEVIRGIIEESLL